MVLMASRSGDPFVDDGVLMASRSGDPFVDDGAPLGHDHLPFPVISKTEQSPSLKSGLA
jgi:hypothetical protein